MPMTMLITMLITLLTMLTMVTVLTIVLKTKSFCYCYEQWYLCYATIGSTWASPPTTLFHRAITISYGSCSKDRDRPVKQSLGGGSHVLPIVI
jgi:hypothetical protein